MKWKLPVLNGINFAILFLIVANVGWFYWSASTNILQEIIDHENGTTGSLILPHFLVFWNQILILTGGFIIGLLISLLVEKIFKNSSN